MKQQELEKTLSCHKEWLDSDGENGVKAEFYEADLRGANLRGANLRYANLQYVDLRSANLYGTDLSRANLRSADFYDANLHNANLRDADLRSADFRGADLQYANFYDANLQYANLKNANLQNVDLRYANLENTKIDYQTQEGLLKKIADIVLSDNSKLNMVNWHLCETTHCLAGWTCHLNETAKELEKTHGPQIAGLLVLGEKAHRYFFRTNKKVIEWLETVK